MSEWTAQDSNDASAEGWDLFDCCNSEWAAPVELQRIDTREPGQLHDFASDPDAWAFVIARAAEGSALHQRALDFLKEESPEEWEHITTWTR